MSNHSKQFHQNSLAYTQAEQTDAAAKDGYELSQSLGIRAIEHAKKSVSNGDAFVEQVLDAKEALNQATELWKKATVDFVTEDFPKAIKEMRVARMAMGAECSLLLKQLGDLRAFFIGKEYEKEIERLSEFTTLCERLKALKDSGFLDTIADTLLKIA